MASLSREVDALIKATKARSKVKLPQTEAELYRLLAFEPRAIQAESLSATKRFNVEVWHRRAGKSFAKMVKLFRSAIACPHADGRYAYLGPTQDQVKDIAWHYGAKFADLIPGTTKKETARELWVPSLIGSVSRIKLYGVDNPRQSLRGLYLDGGVADEWQDIQPTVFTEQVRPMLMDSNRRGTDLFGYPSQYFDFIGTPKGRNQLYVFYNRARMWQEGKPVRVSVDGGAEKPTFSD